MAQGKISRKEALRMKREIEDNEAVREEVYRMSRDITKESKSVIYTLHRGELQKAGKMLGKVDSAIKSLNAKVRHSTLLRATASPAFQEYAEASALYSFIRGTKLPTAGELGMSAQDYLCGLSDLTGELARIAVMRASKKDYKTISHIRDLTEEIYGVLIHIDLRNGELRKKADAIKWNLKKIEEIIYDIGIKSRR